MLFWLWTCFIKDDYKLVLDFDGYAKDIEPSNYLSVLDKLHEMISKEYKATIKDPVYGYMRTEAGQ